LVDISLIKFKIMKKVYLITSLLVSFLNYSQVGINTATPNASAALDVVSTTSGVLIPRMTQAQKTAIASPATGLLIYQTDATAGFYYYTGSAWTLFGGTAWTITGNAGILPASNFLGTTDAQPIVIKTNNTEQMRILSGGNVGIGTNNPGSKLHIVGPAGGTILNDGFEDATIPPFTTAGAGGLWTTTNTAGNFSVGTRGAQSGTGVASSVSQLDYSVTVGSTGGSISFDYKVSSEASFDGLQFYINGVAQFSPFASGTVAWTTATYTLPAGTYTIRWEYSKDGSLNSGSDRAYVDNVIITNNTAAFRLEDGTQGNGKVLVSDASGNATWQNPSSLSTTGWATLGNSGTTASTNFIGTTDSQDFVIKTAGAERARVLANGNVGVGVTVPTSKLEVTADTDNLSVIKGINTNTTASTTSYGVRGEAASTGLGSAGVIGVSTNGGQNEIGVIGDYALWGAAVFGMGRGGSLTHMLTPRDYGVIGSVNYPGATAVYGYDAGNYNGTIPNTDLISYALYGNGKFAVTGTKSASVPTTKGNQLLYCVESPEIWFEDLGGGKLVNGSTHIALDEMYMETVLIDSDHKMLVFLQEEGESNGLIVIKDRDNKGFTVKEINNGHSDAEFSYRIMAKRRFYQNQRFGVDSAQPLENNLVKAKDAPLIETDIEKVKISLANFNASKEREKQAALQSNNKK
jgi:hypothetical protein